MFHTCEEGVAPKSGFNIYPLKKWRNYIGGKFLLNRGKKAYLVISCIYPGSRKIYFYYGKYERYTVEVDENDDWEVFLGPDRLKTLSKRELVIPYWFKRKE